jgi:deazaflavin-dependent oxidoreductase (nitroreductase family)
MAVAHRTAHPVRSERQLADGDVDTRMEEVQASPTRRRRLPRAGGLEMTTIAPDRAPSATATSGEDPAFESTTLPYGPRLNRALGPMQRAFGVVNRWFAVPALQAGLGPLFSTPLTGSLMVLRTTGRTSGLRREAPLGYLIRDGAVYCCAGFGVRTAWFRNLVAEPRVEVLLPTTAFAGIAERVTDRAEFDRVFPSYVRALGMVGRLTIGDLTTADPARVEPFWQSLPLVRIRPTGIAPGPADPGGGQWVLVQAAWLIAFVAIARAVVGRLRRRR